MVFLLFLFLFARMTVLAVFSVWFFRWTITGGVTFICCTSFFHISNTLACNLCGKASISSSFVMFGLRARRRAISLAAYCLKVSIFIPQILKFYLPKIRYNQM